jgi:hypothetical protein
MTAAVVFWEGFQKSPTSAPTRRDEAAAVPRIKALKTMSLNAFHLTVPGEKVNETLIFSRRRIEIAG